MKINQAIMPIGNGFPRVSIRELAGALHSSLSRHKVVLLLKVYLDESGIHDGSPMALMSGIIARAENWDAFEVEWREKLAEVGLPFFHAAELGDIKGDHGYLSEPFRNFLWKALPKIIAKHQLGIITIGVEPSVIARISHEHTGFQKWFSEPYNVCMEGCLQGAVAWSRRFAQGEPLAIVYSRQDEYRQRSLETFDSYKGDDRWKQILVSITFADMRMVPALQAADLVVHEIYRVMRANLMEPSEEQNEALKFLKDAGVWISGGVLSYDDMKLWIANDPEYIAKQN